MEFEIGTEEDATDANQHHPHGPISGARTAAVCEADDPVDEVPEGCVIAELRVLDDPWRDPAARRAMGFLGPRRGGSWMADTHIEALPSNDGSDLEAILQDIELATAQELGEISSGKGASLKVRRDLRWLFLGPQEEI